MLHSSTIVLVEISSLPSRWRREKALRWNTTALPRPPAIGNPYACPPVIQSSAIIDQASSGCSGFVGWRAPLRPLHADDAAADSRLQVTCLQSLRLGLPAGSQSHAHRGQVGGKKTLQTFCFYILVLVKFSKLL